jgi:hypothetical protein
MIGSALQIKQVTYTGTILPPHPEESDNDLQFFLWGLTYHLFSEILVLCGEQPVANLMTCHNATMDYFMYALEHLWSFLDRNSNKYFKSASMLILALFLALVVYPKL